MASTLFNPRTLGRFSFNRLVRTAPSRSGPAYDVPRHTAALGFRNRGFGESRRQAASSFLSRPRLTTVVQKWAKSPTDAGLVRRVQSVSPRNAMTTPFRKRQDRGQA